MSKATETSWVGRLGTLGRAPGDDERQQTEKGLLVLLAILSLVAGCVWGVLYIALLPRPLGALIPLSYAAGAALGLVHLRITKQASLLRFILLALMLVLPFAFQATLGGIANGSAAMVWAFLAPTGALLLYGTRTALVWFVLYCGLVVIAVAAEPTLSAAAEPLPTVWVTILTALNVLGVSVLTFLALLFFVRQRDRAMASSERLLLNVLPAEIAPRLKRGESTIADAFDSATVMFADIVDSTPLSMEMEPEALIRLLNQIFSRFDELAERHGVVKIRTIGDNYMAVAGVPRKRTDHAQAMARMALDICDYVSTLPPVGARRIDFRIGLNSGPLVAGVIGKSKFVYDLWGDPVNTAARMESHGSAGRIQVSRSTYELLKDEFVLESRGTIEIKGKGTMETWYLIGSR